MKILFFTTDEEDYLQDSVLHGLIELYREDTIDFPYKSIMYKDCPDFLRKKVRGNGFTLYFLLEGRNNHRQYVLRDLRNNKYDYIIFSSIQRQIGLYLQLIPYLKKEKTIILDGEDTSALFSYHGYFWRKFYYWFIPRPNKRFYYYKREWTSDTKFHRYYKLIPKALLKFFPEPKNLRPISFSIPEEKIVKALPVKTKLFPKHIVDEEIAGKVEGSFTKYTFENEADYYLDLQSSKYGITTKRSGWDCMRHYEIAANGAVPCFKDLNMKTKNCAPHSLSEKNCLIYKDYSDLMQKINSISEIKYQELQANALEWVKQNSTKKRSQRLLEDFRIFND